MTVDNDEPIHSISDAQKRVPMSLAWWRQKIFRKELRYLKIGGRVFIPESTIIELLRKAVVEPRVEKKLNQIKGK